MPFAYYSRLSRRDQAIYRRSDAVSALPIPGVEALRPAADALRAALFEDSGEAVAQAAFRVSAGICHALGVRVPRLEIHAVRPRGATQELHGLYVPTGEDDEPPAIRVWMRTARRGRVVAFRTFLRTLLHELVHHLDLEALGLDQSFHTEGFFRRESSLFRQLVPPEPAEQRELALPRPTVRPAPPRAAAAPASRGARASRPPGSRRP